MKKFWWLGLVLIGILAAYLYVEREGFENLPSNPDESTGASVNGNPEWLPQGNPHAIPPVSGNKLVDVIADEIAKKGAGAPEVADLVSASQGACGAFSEMVRKGAKPADWASRYLATACQGFDASQYRGLRDPAPDFLAISIEGGQAAATEAALNYLKRPDGVLAALQAVMVLEEGGKLPGEASAGLSREQLARVIAAANASAMCSGQNGCAVDRILAASTCMDSTCPVGTTYEMALRRDLSPAELEASYKLRDWLVSIRN